MANPPLAVNEEQLKFTFTGPLKIMSKIQKFAHLRLQQKFGDLLVRKDQRNWNK